jgi:MFS family permease
MNYSASECHPPYLTVYDSSGSQGTTGEPCSQTYSEVYGMNYILLCSISTALGAIATIFSVWRIFEVIKLELSSPNSKSKNTREALVSYRVSMHIRVTALLLVSALVSIDILDFSRAYGFAFRWLLFTLSLAILISVGSSAIWNWMSLINEAFSKFSSVLLRREPIVQIVHAVLSTLLFLGNVVTFHAISYQAHNSVNSLFLLYTFLFLLALAIANILLNFFVKAELAKAMKVIQMEQAGSSPDNQQEEKRTTSSRRDTRSRKTDSNLKVLQRLLRYSWLFLLLCIFGLGIMIGSAFVVPKNPETGGWETLPSFGVVFLLSCPALFLMIFCLAVVMIFWIKEQRDSCAPTAAKGQNSNIQANSSQHHSEQVAIGPVKISSIPKEQMTLDNVQSQP